MKTQTPKRQKINYRLHVELNRDNSRIREYKRLEPGGVYYLGRNERRAEYVEIVMFLVDVLEKELPGELKKYVDDDLIEVRAQDVFEGSIEILFNVVLNTLTIVSGVHDVVSLISSVAELFMRRRLKDEYGEAFAVDVSSLARPGKYYYDCMCGKPGRSVAMAVQPVREAPRDAFFWYLVVMNAVLSVIVAVLVAGAVWGTYFG